MALTDICLRSGAAAVEEFSNGYTGTLSDIDLRYSSWKPMFNMARGNTGVLVDNDIVGRGIVVEFPAISGSVTTGIVNYAF